MTVALRAFEQVAQRIEESIYAASVPCIGHGGLVDLWGPSPLPPPEDESDCQERAKKVLRTPLGSRKVTK